MKQQASNKLFFALIWLLGACAMFFPTQSIASVDWEKLQDSVGLILCRVSPSKISRGSGFLISRQGHIITNHHVIKECPSGSHIQILFSSSSRFTLKKLASSSEKDLALLQAELPPNKTPLTLFDGEPKVGDKLRVIGFPGLADLALDRNVLVGIQIQPSMTEGIVSRNVVDHLQRRVLQTNALVKQGNSGGPTFDECGRVVGVATYGIRLSEGLNFAVSSQELLQFLKPHRPPLQSTFSRCSPSSNQPSLVWWIVGLFFLVGVGGIWYTQQQPAQKRIPTPSLSAQPATMGLVLGSYQRSSSGEILREQAPSPKKENPSTSWTLLGISGEFDQSSIPLSLGSLILGRDPKTCHLVFGLRDSSISKVHAEIQLSNHSDPPRFCDRGSTNGSFLDGKRLAPHQWIVLRHGQQLQIGDQGTRFVLESKK